LFATNHARLIELAKDSDGTAVAITKVMRSVVGILLVAVVGIHCSAPVADDHSTFADDIVSKPAPAPEDSADPNSGAATPSQTAQPTVAGFDALVKNGQRPIITSIVNDPNGALYVTGTFVDSVTIGGTVLRSHGDKDVFLLKLDSANAFQWVRSVGSAAAEWAPRVTTDTDGHVNVIGMTKGEGDMDCGKGPLQEWSSKTFFVCIFGGADGAALEGGVFPTGSP
jgi:hypothetical protein